jgi:hypothetical protein
MTSDALWYELRNAVYSKDFSVAETVLKANPHLRTARNGIGETVLHFLAVENDLEGVAWLRARGFDLNEQNSFGTPTIFEVAGLGYKDLLLWFIENGGNVEALDRDGEGILAYLRQYDEEEMAQFLKEKFPHLALLDAKPTGRA